VASTARKIAAILRRRHSIERLAQRLPLPESRHPQLPFCISAAVAATGRGVFEIVPAVLSAHLAMGLVAAPPQEVDLSISDFDGGTTSAGVEVSIHARGDVRRHGPPATP
jgi:hypothetical protein